MRAMVITDFGGPEVFEARDLPKPQPGTNELLVKVEATSVNPIDYKIRQAGSWLTKPPDVIGYDVSGVVEAVGAGIVEFNVGDEVYYTPEIAPGSGSYAEYNLVSDLIVEHKPKNISHEEAACVPLAGGTAWDAIVTRGKLEVGESVLIHGAGGVGSFAIQIASSAGARVFAVCSDYMVNTVKELGAYKAINYKTEDYQEIIRDETDGQGVDMVLDTVGGDILTESIQVTKPFGRMVGIVSTDTGFPAANRKNITVHFLFLQRARYKLIHLRRLIEQGQIKPLVDSIMPLEKVGEAHRRLEEGGVKGKIALHVG
jgi:NADPH2:quinone reductase